MPTQIVAQGLGDELVDLVADCARQAAHDGACRLLRRGAAGGKRQRIEEGRDQAQLLDRCVGCSGSAATRLKLGSKRSTVSVSIEWPKR